jgi:hypothetical protein
VNLSRNFKLPCLDELDYAAVAQYLERLALEFEALAAAQQAQMEAVINRPTAIWRWNDTPFPINTTGFALLSFGPSALVYANYTVPPFGLGPEWNEGSAIFPGPGIYHLGVSMRVQAVGAVTANSGRTLNARLIERVADTTRTVSNADYRTSTPSVAGGDYYTVDMIGEVAQNFEDYSAVSWFTHENVGSDMQIVTGWAWVTRLGGADIIEVA